MQKRLEVTLMDKQTGPKGFLVVLPGEIIEIEYSNAIVHCFC